MTYDIPIFEITPQRLKKVFAALFSKSAYFPFHEKDTR
jgi:hypothetical protein